MVPILVPGPPASAFNKHRRASDLIKKQVDHFKHLEDKLPPAERERLPKHAIVTEDDAARYIAAFTRYLKSRQTTSVQKRPVEIGSHLAKQSGLAIAAEADVAHSKPKKTVPRRKKEAATASKRKK